MSGPRIPRRLARRLDRLARRAHAFHRFAHHPLCEEYAGEIFRAGRRARICRGCALAATGGIAGAGLAMVLPSSSLLAASSIVLALGATLASLRTRRIGKIGGRFLPASLLGHALVSGLHAGNAAIAIVALATTALLVRAYRRRGPDRSPCRACPERLGTTPCRGYAPLVRRERAFQRRAGRILSGSA